MTEGEKSTTKKEAGSGSVKSDAPENRRDIERSVEDIFRKFESKSETIHKRQEIIDEFPDIRIEIAEKDVPKPVADKKVPEPKAEKAIQKPKAGKSEPKPRPAKNKIKIIRPVFLAGAVLVVAAAIIFIAIKPPQAPTTDTPADMDTLHKIVQPLPDPHVQSREEKMIQPVPKSDMQPREEKPAQPIPAGARKSEELREFLMKWKTAWENTAGKGGDMETFMSFYSDSFNSKGMTRSEWQNDKAQKNSQKEWIRLELKNILIAEPVADDRTDVSFKLTYSSSNYSDETYHTLILKKEASGWKISEAKIANE